MDGCCLVALLLVFGPRLIIFLMWLFTNYLARAYDGAWILPLLGFFLLPWTTLAYAFAINSGFGLSPVGILIVALGLLLDLGSHGGGYYRRRRGGPVVYT